MERKIANTKYICRRNRRTAFLKASAFLLVLLIPACLLYYSYPEALFSVYAVLFLAPVVYLITLIVSICRNSGFKSRMYAQQIDTEDRFDDEEFTLVEGSESIYLSKNWLLYYRPLNHYDVYHIDTINTVSEYGKRKPGMKKIWMQLELKNGTVKVLQYKAGADDAEDQVRQWLHREAEKCPACGAPYEKGQTVCVYCGTELPM